MGSRSPGVPLVPQALQRRARRDSWKGGRVGMVSAKQRAGIRVSAPGFSVATSRISEVCFSK